MAATAAGTEHQKLDGKYSVTDRLRKLLPPDPSLTCPCRCAAPEVGVFRMDDGDLYLCWTCLQGGYACRLIDTNAEKKP